MIVLLLFVALCGSTYLLIQKKKGKVSQAPIVYGQAAGEQAPLAPRVFGFKEADYIITDTLFKQNEFWSQVLTRHGVDYSHIDKLVKKTSHIYDSRNMRAGKRYAVLADPKTKAAQYFIYEPSVYSYYVFNLQDTMGVHKVVRPIETHTRMASGHIKSSLWQALIDAEMHPATASLMEQALAWNVDFYHVQKDDKFRLIFDENYIEGELVGVEALHASWFKNGNTEFYAFRFASEEYDGFFDENAHPTKKAFLKSPLKYGRISSRFNLRRFHPVLKRRKAHLGTDYAAPHGTPIMAVADGTITKASRTRGNGNYIKMRHDKTYETQYLHMSRFAEGISPGVRVKQGQTIGFVGSTGLATGPHVCFRFWKNGRQVNHLKENLPPPKVMEGPAVDSFFVVRDSLKLILDEIPIADSSEMLIVTTAIDSVTSETNAEVDP